MLKNYTKVVVNKFGDKCYYNDKGQYHRLDGGPAKEWKDGSKAWCINNKSHKIIDPSDEYFNGDKYWIFKNKYHRIGGKAIYDHWIIHGKEYTAKEYYNIVWDI